MSASLIISTLLQMFPHMSGNARQCIVQNRERIEATLNQISEELPNVPTDVMAVVALMETHLGCDPYTQGNWGTPQWRYRVETVTPMTAARIMSRSIEVCGDIPHAIMRFRSGACNPQRPAIRQLTLRYRDNALRLVRLVRRRILAMRNGP